METEGIPGTPRTNMWLGNYYTKTWKQCAGGQRTTYANWNNVEPLYEGLYETTPSNPAPNQHRYTQGECALFDLDGWYARDCLHWYHCLCESGASSTAAYRAWYASRIDVWMAPWVAIGAWTFIIGALLGIVPGMAVFIRHMRTKQAPDWSSRVRSRVQVVLLTTGWLVLCLGFAPVIAFFVGLHAVYAIGYPQGYAALIPIGITCWLLAVVPTNPKATHRALVFALVIFSVFALVGLLAVLFWGVWSYWVVGVAMGVIFLFTGTLLAAICARQLRKQGGEHSRLQLRRVWACARAFFMMLFVISIVLLIDYTVNLFSQWSENVGWIVLAISSLLCSALTHPSWRARFCVWLSGVGVKVGEKAEAVGAARLIWIELADEATSKTAAGSVSGSAAA